MSLRSKAEIARSWALFEGAMRDPACRPDDHLEAVLGWDPPTESEFASRAAGHALELAAEAKGVTMPSMPSWLAEIAGISEVARWCLAALLEDDVRIVAQPINALYRRFATNPVFHDLATPLRELRRRGLIRGDSRAIAIVQRRAA